MKILVIEPDEEQVNLIQSQLRAAGHKVTCAYDGRIGWQFVNDQAFDIILLTPELPGINGYELIRSIRFQDKQTALLMLGTPGQTDQQQASMQVGADQFLSRPLVTTELLSSLRELCRLTRSRQPRWIRLADLDLNLTERIVYREGRSIELTERESQLLAILMQYQGRVVSKQQLLERIWGETNPHRLNRVEVCMTALRKKIDYKFSQKLIQTVLSSGYVLLSLGLEDITT